MFDRWFRKSGAVGADATVFVDLLLELESREMPVTGEWLARLVAILRPLLPGDEAGPAERLRALTAILLARPELAAAFCRHLERLLSTRMHRILYAESGVLTSPGIASALTRRTMNRLLPPATDTQFLQDLVSEVFDRPRDYRWMRAIPSDDWEALFRAIGIDGPGFAQARRVCRTEAVEALRLISTRLAALGNETALLRYLPALARYASPFNEQTLEVRRLIEHLTSGESGPADAAHLEVLLQQCDEYVDAVRRRSRQAGVAVNLVFLLACIEQSLFRLRLLRDVLLREAELHLRSVPEGVAHRREIVLFLALVRQENRRDSVRDLFRGTTELLARRVTEQASRSGEHYVTGSWGEFVQMYRAAAGAGFIIATLALIKLRLGTLGMPLAWEALAYSLNYGLGFVLIHALHLTIATKQPAMTAATLAGALDGRDSRESRLNAIAGLAAQVSRSQWVSIAGNVVVTMLTAFSISLLAAVLLGWRPASPEKALHLLEDLHPWRSLALFYAAIAGVYLFLSGLISGYYDNLSLYHRVPERIRRIRWLRSLIGEERLARFASYVEHNLGALAGNFLFGCMLGVTPILGKLLGLPLDIRHVAFGSANFAYGLVGTGFAVPWTTIVVTAAGVLLIGFVNLLVSFNLALRVALRSRGIVREDTEGMGAAIVERFLRSPREFFWPPRGTPTN